MSVNVAAYHRLKKVSLFTFATLIITCVWLAVVNCNTERTDETFDAIELERSWGVRAANAYYDGGEQILLTINGHSVTAGEFLEARTRIEIKAERRRHELSLIVPDEEWNFFAEGIPGVSPGTKMRESSRDAILVRDRNLTLLSIYENHSLTVQTLTELIGELAMFDVARKSGHVVSDDEVAREINNIRQSRAGHTARIPDPRVAAASLSIFGWPNEFDGYMNVVGEDRYWNEIFPGRLKRFGAINVWIRQLYSEFGSVEASRITQFVRREALETADWNIHPVLSLYVLPVTREQLVAYSDEIWEFNSNYKPPPVSHEMVVEYVVFAEPDGQPVELRERVKYFSTPPPLRESDFVVATAGPDTPVIIDRFIIDIPVATPER